MYRSVMFRRYVGSCNKVATFQIYLRIRYRKISYSEIPSRAGSPIIVGSILKGMASLDEEQRHQNL